MGKRNDRRHAQWCYECGVIGWCWECANGVQFYSGWELREVAAESWLVCRTCLPLVDWLLNEGIYHPFERNGETTHTIRKRAFRQVDEQIAG